MPINRPALALGPGPRGVQDARHWVRDACRDLGRPELTDCAQLGTSELVTNAVLHGRAPIEVRVRGTREHPRIEVHDCSTDAPVMPTAPADRDHADLLLTFGRGLHIVARASQAWGAHIEADGKTVWFAPASGFAEAEGVEGVLTGTTASPVANPRPADPVTVRVLAVPLQAYAAFHQHLRELRREVRLLALAHESDYPVARDLADLFGALERHLGDLIGADVIETAHAEGREVLDLDVEMSRAATQSLIRFAELLDRSDDFCREARMLTLARSREQRRFQRWLLGEFVRQGSGEQPTAWTETMASPAHRSAAS